MSAKHTPGPWTNHGRGRLSPGFPHSAVAAKTLIARVYSEAFGDPEQEAANANLIAAAPDLLEALEAASNYLRMASPGNAKKVIDAAIAKAKGQS